MSVDGYRILDEPSPGPLARTTVEPLWPLLALMVGGVWAGLPWFAWNAFAVGSPTRWRELALAVAGMVVNAGLVLGALGLVGMDLLPEGSLPYLFIGITTWKLGVGYTLFLWQTPSVALYSYFGGTPANGMWMMPVAFLGRGALSARLPTLVFLVLM